MSEINNAGMSVDDVLKFLNEKFKAYNETIKKPTILMCGYTGSGKTSIAQAIFGKDTVGEDKIGQGTPATQGYIEYKNNLITIHDSKGLEPNKGEDAFIKITKEFISSKQESESENVHDHINIFWYVIAGAGARVTGTDVKIINTFRKGATIAIISKKDITKPKQLEAMKEELLKNGVFQENIIAVSYDEDSGENEGMIDVMNRTYILLPKAFRMAFDEAQILDIEKGMAAVTDKKSHAVGIISTATVAACGVAAIPIPFSDALVITPVQLTMVGSLCALYGVAIDKNQILPLIASFAGKSLATSLTKFIPGFGSVISAGVAVTLTGAMGWYIQSRLEAVAIARVKGEETPFSIDIGMFWEFFKNFKK